MSNIVTEFVYPPIPLRQFDWAAHYDDPEGPTGTGATEQEAIDNLLSDHPPCKNKSPYVRTDGGCLQCDADCGEACRPQLTLSSALTKVLP